MAKPVDEQAERARREAEAFVRATIDDARAEVKTAIAEACDAPQGQTVLALVKFARSKRTELDLFSAVAHIAKQGRR